jgi:hypothetical protein
MFDHDYLCFIRKFRPKLTHEIDSSADYFVKFMHLSLCPENYGFLPQTTRVILLSDGRLFIDNGAVAEVYDDGFCIDNFVDNPHEAPHVSAFVCNHVEHSIR